MNFTFNEIAYYSINTSYVSFGSRSLSLLIEKKYENNPYRSYTCFTVYYNVV